MSAADRQPDPSCGGVFTPAEVASFREAAALRERSDQLIFRSQQATRRFGQLRFPLRRSLAARSEPGGEPVEVVPAKAIPAKAIPAEAIAA